MKIKTSTLSAAPSVGEGIKCGDNTSRRGEPAGGERCRRRWTGRERRSKGEEQRSGEEEVNSHAFRSGGAELCKRWHVEYREKHSH